jgi:excisionase family DNA binding protein
MAHALNDPLVPTREDSARARAVQVVLGRDEAASAALVLRVGAGGEETTFDLPPLVTLMLKDLLQTIADGKAVSLVPVEAEITTQQAANILNVSRPFVIGLVEKGLLPARMVGNQRRLPLQDVLAYKANNRARRREALAELAEQDRVLGLE